MTGVVLLLFAGTMNVKAALVDGAVESFENWHVYGADMSSIKNDKIIVKWSYSNYNTTDAAHGDYSNPYIDIQGFEIQVCTDRNYPADQVKTYKTKKFVDNTESASYTYKLPVSVLGKNGGKLYGRIRAYGKIKTVESEYDWGESTSLQVGDTVYGGYQDLKCWQGHVYQVNFEEDMTRDYFEYVKINKTNFGGMYSLMKDGYSYCDEKGNKTYYDKNHDGWLDPSEIQTISNISNYSYKKYGTGYEQLWGQKMYQCKISDLKGLNYLPFVGSIYIRDYTGTKVDLTKYPHINSVYMCEFWKDKFQLIAPDVREIKIESETGGSWKDAKLKTVDVSKCTSAVKITVGGSVFRYITTKLPKETKNLRWISLSYNGEKKIDLNKYKNLKIAYFYAGKFVECKLDQCTKLKYAYFYQSDNIKSVDLRKAKGLKAVDIYGCKNLKVKEVKTVKTTKKTVGKGRQWETTDAWKKLVEDIYKKENEHET